MTAQQPFGGNCGGDGASSQARGGEWAQHTGWEVEHLHQVPGAAFPHEVLGQAPCQRLCEKRLCPITQAQVEFARITFYFTLLQRKVTYRAGTLDWNDPTVLFPTAQHKFSLPHWLSTPGLTAYPTRLIFLLCVPPLFTAWLPPPCSPPICV